MINFKYTYSMLIYDSPSDFCLSILWIDESVPHAWFSRRGFVARKSLLLLWLFVGSFLLMGYKAILHSSLITINYEDKFETLDELVQAGIPVTFPKDTILDNILSTDPRPTVQRMYKNSISVPYAGGRSPRWIRDK